MLLGILHSTKPLLPLCCILLKSILFIFFQGLILDALALLAPEREMSSAGLGDQHTSPKTASSLPSLAHPTSDSSTPASGSSGGSPTVPLRHHNATFPPTFAVESAAWSASQALDAALSRVQAAWLVSNICTAWAADCSGPKEATGAVDLESRRGGDLSSLGPHDAFEAAGRKLQPMPGMTSDSLTEHRLTSVYPLRLASALMALLVEALEAASSATRPSLESDAAEGGGQGNSLSLLGSEADSPDEDNDEPTLEVASHEGSSGQRMSRGGTVPIGLQGEGGLVNSNRAVARRGIHWAEVDCEW